MAGVVPTDFAAWMKETTRALREVSTAVRKSGIPRYCTSDARPYPERLQPGTPLFEQDTNRTIYVNATQDGFVNALGTAV